MRIMEKRLGAKAKIFFLALICIGIITIVFGLYYFRQANADNQQEKDAIGALLVDLNELTQLAQADNPYYQETIASMKEKINAIQNQTKTEDSSFFFVLYFVCAALIVFIFILVYIIILRPFDELQDFAEEIANGNLDKEIQYKRVNMFGEFTWAFDHMRNELIRSRKCEAEAIENNKTVIATLSHDIKTPIASIRGYAEALTMNMDSTPERRERFAEVIMRKCDDVTKITNDLFLHSIHDLDKLTLCADDIELADALPAIVESLSGNMSDIKVIGAFPAGTTVGDAGRIAQVVENIITNSRKYAAGSDITIASSIDADNYYIVSISDQGPGILNADMPFIFNKFYRGANVEDAPGAGLGLYIVKFIMEQMQGKVVLESSREGLCTKLYYKLK